MSAQTKLTQRLLSLPLEARKMALAELRAKGIDALALPIPVGLAEPEGSPASAAQARMFFLWKLAPEATTYSIPLQLKLRGVLNQEALSGALDDIVARHSSLRTVFFQSTQVGSVGRIFQQVLAESKARETTSLGVVDLRELSAEQQSERLGPLLEQGSRQRFNLEQQPGFRAQLLKLAEQEHWLLLGLHHIVADEWSLELLTRDLSEFYAARLSGIHSGKPALKMSVADFSLWQSGLLEAGVADLQWEYWKAQLAGTPALLDVALDGARPAIRNGNGSTLSCVVEVELVARLRLLAEQQKTSLFTVLLATFNLLLSRLTGQQDLSVAVPITGRGRAETAELVGLFVNTVVVRVQLHGSLCFSQLLSRVHHSAREAQSHGDLPFEQLVEGLSPVRSPSHAPLVQVAFNHRGKRGPGGAVPQSSVSPRSVSQGSMSLSGLEVTPRSSASQTARFDLGLNTAEGLGGQLHASLEYATDILNSDTIEALLDAWRQLLAAVVRSPKAALADLLPRGFRNNCSQWLAPEPRGHFDSPALHEQILKHCEQSPGQRAVVHGRSTMTYGQLAERAEVWACALGALKFEREPLVGLLFEPGGELLAAMLGALSTGVAYVPLDPSLPSGRLAGMVEDSGLQCVLTSESFDRSQSWGVSAWTFDSLPAIVGRRKPRTRPTHPLQLAYCIFTSGSTGRPKGVGVSRESLRRSLRARTLQHVQAPQALLVLAPWTSDVGSSGILWSLSEGATVHLPTPECARDPERVLALIDSESISHVMWPPSSYAALRPGAVTARAAKCLRSVLVGGEACPRDLPRRHFESFPDTAFVNEYGPTEATVWCTALKLDDAEAAARIGVEGVPLGRPVAEAELLVCDADLIPVPRGTVGELLLAGPVLARGYQGQPGLTAERFVPNPLGPPGTRIYRTGDRVRLRADDTLFFIGRQDGQVKVRGHRVEVAEIEQCLLEHPSVKEAVVGTRVGESGVVLVAQCIPLKPLDSAGNEALPSELIDWLKQRLPSYLVPHHLALVSRLPRSATGHIDRQALPELEELSATGGQQRVNIDGTERASWSSLERELAEIWCGVLRLPEVTRQANFFELGGDSISSLLMVSRAREVGIMLSPKAIFEQQTIELLARVAKRLSPQEEASLQAALPQGCFGLLPAQVWHMEQALPDRHHFNQSVLLQAESPLDIPALQRALSHVVAQHDALRLSFERQPNVPGGWSQRYRELDDASLTAASVGSASQLWVAESQEAGARDANEPESLITTAQRSLKPEQGLVFRALVIPRIRAEAHAGSQADYDYLFFTAHHLVVDAVSWRILLADLGRAYEQAKEGAPIQLPAKTTSVGSWSKRIGREAQSRAREEESSFWSTRPQDLLTCLPPDRPHGDSRMGLREEVRVQLSRHQTAVLLGGARAVLGAQAEALLLTALSRAACLCAGGSERAVLLTLEGHGRDALSEELDLTRTVGWFTNLYPVCLSPFEGGTTAGGLRAVREQLRKVPDKGFAYGVFRFLAAGAVNDALRQLPESRIGFNYLGQLSSSSKSRGPFLSVGNRWGDDFAASTPLPTWLSINARVSAGVLSASFIYSRELYDRETIEELGRVFSAELDSLLVLCIASSPEDPGPEESAPLEVSSAAAHPDVALSGYPYPASQLEDAYGLSPMQAGMMFRTQYAPDESVFVNQLSVTIRGLNVERLRQAWAGATKRHALLRTGFVWDDERAKPMQFVVKDLPASFELRHLVQPRQGELSVEVQCRQLAEAERARGFDLATPPLHRLLVVALPQEGFRLIWTHHHIVMDGWSSSRLIAEVLAACSTTTPSVPHGEKPAGQGRFRDYIDWLEARDPGQLRSFWTGALHSLVEPTRLSTGQRSERGLGVHRSALDESGTTRLLDFCRAQRITPSSLIQAAWLLVLSRHAGAQTTGDGAGPGAIVCGVAVAGRPPELPKAEEILGLFMNTIPIALDVDPALTVSQWLQRVQLFNVEAREHEHVPLTDIQSWAGLSGQALFDTAIAFENYPVSEALQADSNSASASLTFTQIEDVQPTGFALGLVVHIGRRLAVRWSYEKSALNQEFVSQVQEHFHRVLQQFCAEPASLLRAVSLSNQEERNRVTTTWARSPYRQNSECRLLHECIERSVQRAPERIALIQQGQVGGSLQLSYGELEVRACALSRTLVQQGVGPEVRVGLWASADFEFVVALYAILKAGGAYVPLDPEAPVDRLVGILQSADISRVLVPTGPHAPSVRFRGRIEAGLVAADNAATHPGMQWLAVEESCELGRNLEGDPDSVRAERKESAFSLADLSPRNAAYCIFTSGSTGAPKGVVVSHQSAVNSTLAAYRDFHTGPVERQALLLSAALDGAVASIFWTLNTGGSLRLLSREARGDASELARRTVLENWTHLVVLPSFYLQILGGLDAEQSGVSPLCDVVVAGENCPSDLWALHAARSPAARLTNKYGPTEAAVWCAGYTVKSGVEGPVPIGRPSAGSELWILDETLNVLGPGIPGEIYIGGVGLARGYLSASQTAERFIPHPGPGNCGQRLYRSGDVARYRSDGSIEFLGRVDRQIKLAGLRIELGEIEAALRSCGSVQQAAVRLLPSPSGQRLVGYVVRAPSCVEQDTALFGHQLREKLHRRLPVALLPSLFVDVEALPRAASGKLEPRLLPEPDWGAQGERPPESRLQRVVADVWQHCLKVDGIGLGDDFFRLGGQSLVATQVVSQLRSEWDWDVPLRMLFENSVLEDFCDAILRHCPGADSRDSQSAQDGEEAGAADRLRALLAELEDE